MVGNSHAAALREAAVPAGAALDWLVIPGGYGPALRIEGDRVWPAVDAPEAVVECSGDWRAEQGLDLSRYDSVLFSAAGLPAARPGFAHHPLVALTIASFADTVGDDPARRVSQSVFRLAVERALGPQHGLHSVLALGERLGARLCVQPTPLPAATVALGSDSMLARRYGADTQAALAWYWRLQHGAIQQRLTAVVPAVRWLGLPDPSWLDQGCTPAHLAHAADGWHMNADYGDRVMRQWMSATG